jgi:uncharacterized radical SAM protein YgiQ
VQARSVSSVIGEAEILIKDPDFKGYIHDIGGPTANFSAPSCEKSVRHGACRGKSCVFPKFCGELKVGHGEYINLLKRVASLNGVKKVFVRSGLRMDYILADPKGREFLEELCRSHVSGQLKIAPEHASPDVLRLMRKSPPGVTVKFIKMFREINEKLGKKQFVVPYFMSSHPGCGIQEALKLVEFMRQQNLRPEQAQEFTPTPGTISSCMYHTGLDPLTGEKIHVPKNAEERAVQRALLQYWMPKNRRALAVWKEPQGSACTSKK